MLTLPTDAYIVSAVAYSHMLSPFCVYSSQYHLRCCQQKHVVSFVCLQWTVSPLLLHTAISLLLSLPTVASIISTIAHSYMSSPFSVYIGQYHLYCCPQLNVFSFPCLQWSVSPLLLPTATYYLLSLPTVVRIVPTVAYNYMPSPVCAYSGQYHLYCCLQLNAFSFLCL